MEKKNFKLFFAMVTVIMVVLFGSVFTSCSNDDDLLLAGGTQTEQVSSLSVDSVKAVTRGMTDIETSNGWTLVMDLGSSYGYKLYSKTSGIKTVYLQKVNLSMGTKLQFGFGQQISNPSLQNSPYFKRKYISYFWNYKPNKAISVTNCSYFGYDNVASNEVPALLCHPIKVGGTMKSIGSYNYEGYKRKIGFNFTTQEAWVAPYEIYTNDVDSITNDLLSSTVICGFSPDRPDNPSSLATLSRFMIGIKDQDNDISGKKEVLYMLTYYGQQSGAKQKLTNLGCSANDIIMLDGSGSAQLIAKDPDSSSSTEYHYNYNNRTIPNVIYVCKP